MDHPLAFDIASKTGWAARIDGQPECGTLDLRTGVPKRGEMRGLELLAAYREASRLIAQVGPSIVIYEAPFIRGAGSHHLIELIGVVRLAATEAGLATACLTAGQVRKAILGDGSADKAAVEAFVREQGWRPDGPDAADAAGLIEAWGAIHVPEVHRGLAA